MKRCETESFRVRGREFVDGKVKRAGSSVCSTPAKVHSGVTSFLSHLYSFLEKEGEGRG